MNHQKLKLTTQLVATAEMMDEESIGKLSSSNMIGHTDVLNELANNYQCKKIIFNTNAKIVVFTLLISVSAAG